MCFDVSHRGGLFDYTFTRHIGDHDSEAPPARFRVHVLLLAARGGEAIDSSVGFSFPLCGSGTQDWTSDRVLDILRAQALEFSHHVDDIDLTDLLKTFWSLAKFSVSRADETGLRHLVIRLVVDTQSSPGYVFIHEDSWPEPEALRATFQTWSFIRHMWQERLAHSRVRSDADYSPSKPLSKIARLAAAAASVFSQ